MSTILAVKGWYTGDILGELKRAALLADKIAVRHVHAEGECDKFPHVKNEIEWLKAQGIAVPPPEVKYDVARYPWLKDYDRRIIEDPASLRRVYYMKHLMDDDVLEKGEKFEQELYVEAANAYARAASTLLTEENQTAVPMLPSEGVGHTNLPTKKSAVVRLSYDRLPMPDDQTPWDAILDWRSDDDAKGKFARLRTWINRASHADSTISEIEDDLESALYEYRTYMRVQHVRIPTGRFEAICTGAVKFLEELPKIKVSPLIEAVFRFDRVQAEMTEKELSAPNREVAYIVEAQDTFSKDNKP